MRWQSARNNAFVEVRGGGEIILPEDVLSFTLSEELESMPKGSLQLNDPNIVYSRILPRGETLSVSWGYVSDRFGLSLSDVLTSDRAGTRLWVQNPTGSGAENGNATYNCNLLGMDFRGQDDPRTWEEGTKAGVVRAVLQGMGILTSDVRFDRGNDRVTDEAYVVQWETDFAFLVRLAREWGAVFCVGFTRKGERVAAFVDPRRLTASAVVASMADRPISAIPLTWRAGDRNVISYSWQHNEGDSGVGDSVSIEWVGGEPQMVRRVVEQDRVITWRLNQERVNEEFNRRRDAGGIAAETELVNEILQAKDFEQVERFFDAVESETAPNGVGFSVSLRMFGDTRIAPGARVSFGQGFPDLLADRGVDFYVNKVVHSINASGYFCEVEVADTFALSPTGVTAFGRAR